MHTLSNRILVRVNNYLLGRQISLCHSMSGLHLLAADKNLTVQTDCCFHQQSFQVAYLLRSLFFFCHLPTPPWFQPERLVWLRRTVFYSSPLALQVSQSG